MAIQDNDSLLETLQEPEEFPQEVCTSREEKWEKELTEALLEISEKILEDDQKSIEWMMGTGWEEAARGWGPISATACLHPQKKQKRLKHGDATDCILCPDLCFISEGKDTAAETKHSTVNNDKDKAGVTDHVLLPTEKELESGFTAHCPSPLILRTGTCSAKASSIDIAIKEQRQAKEKNLHRAIPICTNCYNTKEPLLFNAPILLPPLKASPGNGHAEQMARRREILLQQLVKLNSNGFTGNSPTGQVLYNIDVALERKRLDAMSDLPQESLRVPEPLSFITSCIPKTPVKDADGFQRSFSILAQKSDAGNANSVKHSTNTTPVGFLHTRTMQNKRSSHQQTRPLTDTKVRRAKSGSSRVPDTVLPSLTVTRVDIPVKMRLC